MTRAEIFDAGDVLSATRYARSLLEKRPDRSNVPPWVK